MTQQHTLNDYTTNLYYYISYRYNNNTNNWQQHNVSNNKHRHNRKHDHDDR